MAKADRFADGLTPEERELIHCFQAHFKVDCNRGRVFSRESQQQDRGERQQLLGLCEGSACRRGSCVAVRVVFSGAGCQLLHNPDKGTSRTLDTTPAVSYTVLMCVDAGVCGALLCVLLWWMYVCWMGRGTHGQLAALRWVTVTVTLWVRPPLLAYLLLFSASVGENVCRELRESSCLMGTSLARGGTSQNLACAAYRSFFFGHHMGARGQRR